MIILKKGFVVYKLRFTQNFSFFININGKKAVTPPIEINSITFKLGSISTLTFELSGAIKSRSGFGIHELERLVINHY